MKSVEERAPKWITFLRANEWGIDWKNPPHPEKLEDPETFVHHTAGSRMGANPVTAMRQLQRISYSMNYSTVAYDVVVHRDTFNEHITIMGAREAWRSAATKDRNEEGEAICLMGYFQPGHTLSQRPTDREVEGLAWGIAWMIEHGWSAKDTNILGHRDNPRHPNATSCPGNYLYDQLPIIRGLVTAILTPPPPEPPPVVTPPTTPEGDEAMLVGYVKHPNHPAVYRQWNNGTKTWITDGDEFGVHQFVTGSTPIKVNTMPNRAWMRATGVIVGPIPAGVDAWGVPLS